MAKLIDAAIEATESIIRAAGIKAQLLGSWYALNEPGFDPQEQVEKVTSRKVADDVEHERRREEFRNSLSTKSRRLRKAWQRMADAPEMYEEEDIEAARRKYDASLTDEQRRAEKELAELQGRRKTIRTVKRMINLMDRSGSTDHMLRLFRSKLDAPVNPDHGPMLEAMKFIMYRLTYLLGEQDADNLAVGAIFLSNDKAWWELMPNGTGHEKDFDLRRLTELMRTQVAAELADPAGWQRLNVSVRGVATPALYIEGEQGDENNLRANVAMAMRELPGMEGKIIPVYKIDGARVSETAYRTECRQREKELGTQLGRPDFSGLTQGTMFIGPEASALLKDWTGVDTRAIREPQKRAR